MPTYLVAKFVVGGLTEADRRESEMRGIVDNLEWFETVVTRVDNELLTGLNSRLALGPQGLSVPVLKVLNIWESST